VVKVIEAAASSVASWGIALDSRGDMYVGEVGVTDWKTNFPDEEMPAVVCATRCLQKLERVVDDSRWRLGLIAGR
jgi:hypothetical protein